MSPRKTSSTTKTVTKAVQAVAPAVEPVAVNEEPTPVVSEPVVMAVAPRKFAQNDPILCRSVTPGGLIVNGRSGQKYVFSNVGDEIEIEYQDLNSLKNAHSDFIYKPLLIIEDEELLDDPRWADLAKFYEEKVYGMDDIEEILNLPNLKFKQILTQLPKGLMKQLQLVVAQRMEDGTFDSLQKIKAIDEVCGTDFMKMLPR